MNGPSQSKSLAPHLRKVMLTGAPSASFYILMELLRELGATNLHHEPSEARALQICPKIAPQIIFIEFTGQVQEGLGFVRALRRGKDACRTTPVIVVTSNPTAAVFMAARDVGAHEFMVKPFAMKDVRRRIEAVALQKRDWIEAVQYIGPDRRRFNSGQYQGPRKRLSDQAPAGPMARLEQSLRILASAIKAIESDPEQALRSMLAQTAELAKVASETGDQGLMDKVKVLRVSLETAARSDKLSRSLIEGGAIQLLALFVKDNSAAPPLKAAS